MIDGRDLRCGGDKNIDTFVMLSDSETSILLYFEDSICIVVNRNTFPAVVGRLTNNLTPHQAQPNNIA